MEEDVRLLTLFAMMLQKPQDLEAIQNHLGVNERTAWWYLNRLKEVLCQVPGMPCVKKDRSARTYYLEGGKLQWKEPRAE
jgi:hypothetical protein